jgi:hypothetical protein
LSAVAIFLASEPDFGTTCTKPLWMKSVSMPRLANLAGAGSGGRVDATSIRPLIVDAGRLKCDRIAAISNFSRALLSDVACGAAAAGAANPLALKATGAS